MVSNYEIMRNRMRGEFVKYDQARMIRQFALRHDDAFLYLEFLRRPYRIDRKTGVVVWSEDHFVTCAEADYNESMTIYDVLCNAKDGCRLSGNYCAVHMLKGTVKSGSAGGDLFRRPADGFCGACGALRAACGLFGEPLALRGDVAAKLYPFAFLPVILQYWEADEEFPANLKFMYDENILDYMHYETIFFMTAHIIRRLEEAIGTMSGAV